MDKEAAQPIANPSIVRDEVKKFSQVEQDDQVDEEEVQFEVPSVAEMRSGGPQGTYWKRLQRIG